MSQRTFAREPGPIHKTMRLQSDDDDSKTGSEPKPGTDPRAVVLPSRQEQETMVVHSAPVERTHLDVSARRTP
jgi:hypothetical protein